MGWDDGKNPFNDWPGGPYYGDPIPPKKKPVQLPTIWPGTWEPQIIDNEELLEQYEKQKAKEKAKQEMAKKLAQLEELLAKKKAKELAEEKAKKDKAKKKRKPRKKKAPPPPVHDDNLYEREV